MFALGSCTTFVTHHIRNLRGGSQPVLAAASDGNIYVVKFAENPQGPHLPFNESMGTELYRLCGLPTAPWKVLEVTDSLLNLSPECWLNTPEGKRKPMAGPCFGSRFLWDQRSNMFDFLPGSHFKHVENAVQFWLAWLVDICANHRDYRQAIFWRKPSGRLMPVFIDFGRMFGGATGIESFRGLHESQYWDPRIYPRIDTATLLAFRKLSNTLDRDQVLRKLAVLPDEWKTDSAIQNLVTCLDRLSDISTVERILSEMAAIHQMDEGEESFLGFGQSPTSTLPHPGLQPLAWD